MRIIVIFVFASLLITASALAQTNARQAPYSDRIKRIGRNNAAAVSARVNSRFDTRINSRIPTRIERDGGANPIAAYTAVKEQLTKTAVPIPSTTSIGGDDQ